MPLIQRGKKSRASESFEDTRMKTLVLGAGNLLLSDEGFGVHFIRYLEEHYDWPAGIELLDAGTMGLMISHRIAEADRVYIVDTLLGPGEPGTWRRYTRD